MIFRLLVSFRIASVALVLVALTPMQSSAQVSLPEHYPLALPGPLQLESLDTLKVYGDFLDIRISPTKGPSQILWAAQALPQTSVVTNLTTIEAPVLSPSLSVSESQLIIRAESEVTRYYLDIQLPESWQYQLRVYGAGDINTIGVIGKLTAWSSRGNINVLEQAGPVSLTAMDGVVRVQLLESALSGSSAITMNYGVTSNSALNIALPETARATIRVQAYGGLSSDIPSFQNERPNRVEHDYSDYLEMKLNGGGGDLTLRNLKGDVNILRALPQ